MFINEQDSKAIAEWKERMTEEEQRLFYLVVEKCKYLGRQQATPRDVLDMD